MTNYAEILNSNTEGNLNFVFFFFVFTVLNLFFKRVLKLDHKHEVKNVPEKDFFFSWLLNLPRYYNDVLT